MNKTCRKCKVEKSLDEFNKQKAGRPDAILGYKNDLDVDEHVNHMMQFLNESNL